MPAKRARGDESDPDGVASNPKKSAKREPTSSTNPIPTQTSHKLVERRYRHNLKTNLDNLSMKLPALKDVYACSSLDIEDSGRIVKAPPKAAVIAAAASYIERLESEKVEVNDFVNALQEQVVGLQKLVRCDDCAVLQYIQGLQVGQPMEQDMWGALS